MAVYREGYYAVEQLQKQTVRIFEDACDSGVPVKKGDKNWNLAKQLVDSYKDEENKKIVWSGGCSQKVELIDEWAVGDGRKTVTEATDLFLVSYNKCTKNRCKGFDGFVSVEKIN